jgi:hypothetical protein
MVTAALRERLAHPKRLDRLVQGFAEEERPPVSKINRNSESYREAMLREIEKWLLPPTAAEKELAREITKLPAFWVKFLGAEILEQLDMHPQACHLNSYVFVAQSASGQYRPVTGWKLSMGLCILHSVVEGPEGMFCVTPTLEGTESFGFAPDPDIVLEPGTGFVRCGHEVPTGVRQNPEATMTILGNARSQLLAAEDPYRAMAEASEQFAELETLRR